jgi:uncharacterized protein (TIGR03545 family)
MTGETRTATEAARAPRLFPARMPERQFQRKILRRVYTTGDREFLLGLYRVEQDGSRTRAGDLSPQDAKRLAGLAKSIGRNRGAVQVPRLVILVVIAAGVVAFNLFFKNTLLTRALRSGLEGVFGARAEVAGLDFRPVRGSITIARVTVADRERPMRNLFELGRTEASVDVLRLPEGRFLVRNLECRNVRWDTERRTSGALDSRPGPAAEPAAAEQPEDAAESGGLAQKLGAAGENLLAAIDIPGLIDAQADELASTRRIAETNARLSAQADKWSAEVGAGRDEVDSLAPRVQTIRAFDYSSVRSLVDARQVVEAIAAAAPAVKSLSTRLSAATTGLSADLKTAAAERAAIEAAVTADIAYVRSKVSLSPEAWKSLASGLASRLLEKYLGRGTSWALRAWDATEGLLRQRKAAEKKAAPLARRGRTVRYPGSALPRFLLSSAAFSLAGQPGVPDIEATLRDVTSDPDILGRPASVSAAAALGGQSLSLDATIDTRTGRQSDALVALRADNWDLALEEGLEMLSIRSLSGMTDLQVEATLAGGGARGQGRVSVRGMALDLETGGDPLASAAAAALRAVPEALVSFSFTAPSDGPADVSASTNLDAALAEALGAQAGRLAAEYEGQVRVELMKRLEAGLAENGRLAGDLAGLQKAAVGHLTLAESWTGALADARKQLEKRLKSAIPLPKLGF